MPRNGSGTYSVPNPDFQPNTTISSSEVDENFDDAGDEITNSLPRDGQAGMSGQFKSSDGTAGAPGISFTLDGNSGFYRIGADNIGIAVAGAKVLDISATGLGVTGTLSASGDLNASAGLSAAQDVAFTGDITPSQITADQDNYAPTGHATATVFRLSTDASREITGLAGGADGRVVILYNVGSNNIVLKDEHADSTAANRFALIADVTLAADQTCILQYDGTSTRWRSLGASVTAASASEYRANTADKFLDTDGVWSAAEPVTVSFATPLTLDFATGFDFFIVATSNFTLNFPSNPKSGQKGIIKITHSGAARTMTLQTSVGWYTPGGTQIALSSSSGALDYLSYFVESPTVIHIFRAILTSTAI